MDKAMNILRTAALAATVISSNIFAADSVNVSVTGNIIAAPCIFNGGNASLNINLGNIQASNMATPGSSSDPMPFNLLFTQCPTGRAAWRSPLPALPIRMRERIIT